MSGKFILAAPKAGWGGVFLEWVQDKPSEGMKQAQSAGHGIEE
jgi:hypothetical protein